MHRFFAPALDPGDELVDLPRDEVDHLTRVLRLGAGDSVTVFDGRGNEFVGRVATASRREARVQVLTRVVPAPESAVALTLAPAVLKGDKMDELVRDAVMLGVVAIQPLVTERTETTVAALRRGARLDRWRRIALASVKQCGRAVLPDIRLPLPFASYLDEPRPSVTLMLVEPRARAEGLPVATLRAESTPSEAAVMVGPEGGWADAEWQAARDRGIRLITLGQRTLRADAVPATAICVLEFLWGDL